MLLGNEQLQLSDNRLGLWVYQLRVAGQRFRRKCSLHHYQKQDASSEQCSKYASSSLRKPVPSPSIRQKCYTSQNFRFGDSCHVQAAGRLATKPSPNCLLWTVPHELRDDISVKNNHGWYLVKARRFSHWLPWGDLKFHPTELFENFVDRRSKIL